MFLSSFFIFLLSKQNSFTVKHLQFKQSLKNKALIITVLHQNTYHAYCSCTRAIEKQDNLLVYL